MIHIILIWKLIILSIVAFLSSWLPVEQRIIFKINLLTYKCLNHDAPQYLQDLLVLEQLGRSTRSANTCRLQEKLVRKKSGGRAFRNAALSLWNNLPPETRLSSTINQFKVKLKTHLFKIAYNEDAID